MDSLPSCAGYTMHFRRLQKNIIYAFCDISWRKSLTLFESRMPLLLKFCFWKLVHMKIWRCEGSENLASFNWDKLSHGFEILCQYLTYEFFWTQLRASRSCRLYEMKCEILVWWCCCVGTGEVAHVKRAHHWEVQLFFLNDGDEGIVNYFLSLPLSCNYNIAHTEW